MGGSQTVRTLLAIAVAAVIGVDVTALAATASNGGAATLTAPSPLPTILPTTSPSPSPSPSASPSPSPAPAVQYAWVWPAVVNVWESRALVRRVDRPSMLVPPQMRNWVRGMSIAQRRDLDGRLMTQALHGDKVVVLATSRGWSQVRVLSQTGGHFRTGIIGWVVSKQLRSTVVSHAAFRQAKTVRNEIANARRFLGITYIWAGMSSYGIDCSGLVYDVFRTMNITLPRDAADQSRVGYAVARRHLIPGDLVFFGTGSWTNIHHVGIYIGHGLMLHAPHTGSTVRISPLSSFPDYWGARRIIR